METLGQIEDALYKKDNHAIDFLSIKPGIGGFSVDISKIIKLCEEYIRIKLFG